MPPFRRAAVRFVTGPGACAASETAGTLAELVQALWPPPFTARTPMT